MQRRFALLILSGALAACGGSTTTPPSPTGSGAGSGAGSGTTAAPSAITPVASTAVTGNVARGPEGAVTACAVLSAADIETAIGTHVIEAVPYGNSECRWRVEPLAAFPGAADTWMDVQFFASNLAMRAAEAEPANKGVVTVEGLGDRAFRTNSFHHLWVERGNDAFVVRSRLRAVNDTTDASRVAGEAIEVLLARAVVGRL
jgi:hypothetical protein